MPFSSEELQLAVDGLLLSDGVRMSKLPITGARDVVAAKTRSFDLLATTLLLKPDAYFYLIWLASNAIRRLVMLQLADMATIIEAAEGVDRSTPRISSTAELVNAQAALLNLGAALNQGSASPTQIPPEVDRFRRSIEGFLRNQVMPGVVVGTDVVPTAEEQRETIARLWSDVMTRQRNIAARIEYLVSATSALSSLRLPRSVLQAVTDRVTRKLQELETTLEGPQGREARRRALLELMAARTVMSRAAAFRPPLRVLAPVPRDATTGVLLDGGTPPSLLGIVSGPYNLPGASTLVLEVDGVPAPVVLVPTSQAEVVTSPLTFPGGPVAPAEVAVEVDHGAAVTHALPVSYPDGGTAAADLTSNLAGVTVTWDAISQTLTFSSDDYSDISHLRFLDDTAGRGNFVDWAFGAVAPVQAGVPVEAEVVLEALADIPNVSARTTREVWATLDGERLPGPGLEAQIWQRLVQGAGSGFTSNGTATVQGTTNFEARGVEPGMVLTVTAPGPAVGDYEILSVEGSTLELNATVAATAVPDFYIGPDYSSLLLGARVRVIGGENTGHYRLVDAGPSFIETTPALREDGNVSVVVFTEVLEVRNTSAATSATLEAQASAAQAQLGLPLGLVRAANARIQIPINFPLRGVRPGDQLTLTSPSPATTTHSIVAVEDGRLQFTPPIGFEAGAWGFTVRSQSYLRYDALVAALPVFPDMTELDNIVSRLIRGARFSVTLSAPMTMYSLALVLAAQALDAFQIAEEPTITAVVRLFREHGLDRALDYLLALRITEVFEMRADDVSYSTHVMRAAATAGREVAPVSRYAGSSLAGSELQVRSNTPRAYDPIGGDDEV